MPHNATVPLDAPVVEVALGVAFEPLPELGAIGLARLAADWQGDYPIMREVPGRPSDPTGLILGPLSSSAPARHLPGYGYFQAMKTILSSFRVTP